MNKSSKAQILEHFRRCDKQFVPPLSTYVNLEKYSSKLYALSQRFEIFNGKKLIGLLAAYENVKKNKIFITNLSVHKEFSKRSVGSSLLIECKKFYKNKPFKSIELEVYPCNSKALSFYSKNGFQIKTHTKEKTIMTTSLRDYNQETKDTVERKYAYNFDFDVIHPYLIKSFSPFFNKGSCLELGSFKGDFTRRLLPYFDDITCVEASDEAVNVAQNTLNSSSVCYYNSLFEDTVLPRKYDNIILTHVLEHIDDQIGLLKKIKNNWLSENGKLFIAVPNAHAPSRQIAVKIGIIPNATCITAAEKSQGHTITYNLDILESHVRQGGLNPIMRSGVFFKALANFQWDKLLDTDIISREYLDGCFALGQQYPDLCSSIISISTL